MSSLNSTNKPLMDFIAGRIKNMASIQDLEALKQELQLRERELTEEKFGPGPRATTVIEPSGPGLGRAKVEDDIDKTAESKEPESPDLKRAGKEEERGGYRQEIKACEQ